MTTLVARTLTGLCGLALVLCASGCATEQATRVSVPTPTIEASPLPENFCGLAVLSLPAGWTYTETKPDPFDDEAMGLRATCDLGTGYDGETHTRTLVVWKPQPTAEDTADSLTDQCAQVSRIAAGAGAETVEVDGSCSAIDPSTPAQWSLLGYTEPGRTGVLFVRVDTSDPTVAKTLTADTRRFAANLLTNIPQG
jgi:hypothetical protein